MKNYFKNVIGYEPLKIELTRILDIMHNADKYEKLDVKLPKNFLLYGKPGVGKTLIASTFIEASGWNSYTCRKTAPDGDFIKQIISVFDKAKENQPAIVFLDDMDKFANEDDYHKDAEEYITIQSCIDDIGKNKVFVFATINDYHKIPNSLLRAGRFDKKFEVAYPTGTDAENLIEYFLINKKVEKNVNIKRIAKILGHCSCAELETIINEAGVYAGFNNQKLITMDDIVKACMKVLFQAPESLDDYKLLHIKELAYHEAGHAVIAELLAPDSVNIVSICKHEGNIGGITSQSLSEDYWFSKEDMEKRIITLLGGKAATEIVFGIVDTCANSDIHRAFDIIERIIDNYCSYGFDCWQQSRDIFNTLLVRREQIMSQEMSKYYQEAKKLLVENRAFLDALANVLIEKKTIIAEDIIELKKRFTNI